ncbi:MAG: RagB/SusD family nutrient uptake outer membrane protein [Bacteroidales bacterium]|nr:RagB/SusD family nutrient uptake outer membrane protein [Bacteroidales bacterium]
MNTTNIFRLIILIGIVGLSSSCSDLEEVLLDEQLGEELVNDPNNVQALINPPYASLRRTIEWSRYWALQEVTTDEVIIPTKGTDWYDNGDWQQMHLHTWNSNHNRIEGVWEFLTQGISRANTAIYYIGQFEQTEANKLYIYEARFLRAYYMYLITDLFGQVPFREVDDFDYTTEPEVYDRTKAVNFIISELKEILPHLKTKSELGSTRATSGAANALLAKVYINHEVYTGTAKWSEAIGYCNAVITSSDYAIANDYWSMFLYEVDEHPEFILRVPMDDNVDYGMDVQWTNPTLHYNQVFGNYTSLWNGPATTSTFFETWDEENDARFYDDRYMEIFGFNLGFLHGQQYNNEGTALTQANGEPLVFIPDVNLKSSSENAGVRVVKYVPNPNTINQFRTGNDVPIMRISDIYLLRAEAKLRNGADMSEVLADINAVRAKRSANGKTLPALSFVTLDDILKERGFELYWEGLRRQDLIRFGKFNAAYQEKGETPSYTTVFPAPTSATDVNGNLDKKLGNQ